MKEEEKLNIRVYGLLINPSGEILLSHEEKQTWQFVKFPGGGLEWGEGIIDCLHREFEEETGLEIEVLQHYYTTEFFQESAFRKEEQLISIYYKVRSENWTAIESGQLARDAKKGEMNRFFWKSLKELNHQAVTYPIDQHVLKMLLEEF